MNQDHKNVYISVCSEANDDLPFDMSTEKVEKRIS